MKRFLTCLLLLLNIGLHAATQTKVPLSTNTIDSIKLESDLNAKWKKTLPLEIKFGERIVIYVSGPSTDFEKAGAARIYINNVLMSYPVVYNCPCKDPKDTTRLFTLTCTIGPHDTTWNHWYGFGDEKLSVKLDVGTVDKVYTCNPINNLQLEAYHHASLVFAAVVVGLFLVLTIILVFFLKLNFIRDSSTVDPKPYSLSRFQLLWWTVIIISSYILLFAIRDDFGLLSQSTLILLGISAAGTGFSALVDYSVNDNKDTQPSQPGKNFFYDILSDNNGINIHRYQNFIFTIVFGIVFVYKVFSTANMPNFGVLELSLMGLSTATYVGLKTNENKQTGAATNTSSSDKNIVG